MSSACRQCHNFQHHLAQVHAQGAAAAVREDLEISAGLRGFDHAESVLRAGHGKIVSVVAGDLQEHAGVRAAFVCLAGGVQEARTKAEASGDLFLRREQRREFPASCASCLCIHLHVAEHGEVIAGANAGEMGLQR